MLSINPSYRSKLHAMPPRFTLEGRTLNIAYKDILIYDADTIIIPITIDNQLWSYSCRLLGFDGPELKVKKSDLVGFSEEDQKYIKDSSYKAKDYLDSLLVDKVIIVKTGKFDKY